MQLNILLRGQSNAQILASAENYAGATALTTEVGRLLGFDDVRDSIRLIYAQEVPGASTVRGGTAFLRDWLTPAGRDGTAGWQVGPQEQALLNVVGGLPAGQRAQPTAVLWLHSEYDAMRGDLSEVMWTGALRFEAAQLRAAFGQSAATLPYHFVSAHPFSPAADGGHQIIRRGMETLAADPAFNARIAARAQDIDADWDDPDGNAATREYGGQHISAADALLIATRAAQSIAQGWAAHARPGSPLAQAGGAVDDLGPQVVSVRRSGPASLLLDVAHDAAAGFAAPNAVAAGGQGWSLELTGGGTLQAVQLRVLDADTLRLDFPAMLPDTGGQLYYAAGYGRLAAGGQPGRGNAVYDDHGMPAWVSASGLGVSGASPVAPLSDAEALRYAASHADLSRGAVDLGFLKLHFATFGDSEKRSISFDPVDYLGSQPDLFRLFGTDTMAATRHWIEHGRAEGRVIGFDSLAYTASHADLMARFGTDQMAALQHWMGSGMAEGRGISFDGAAYIASYNDLMAAFGADIDAGTRHFIVSGRAEQRQPGFDGLRYIASSPDLALSLGADAAAGARHWIAFGHQEGRPATGFDAARYLAHYDDLRAAFGQDLVAATRHYIEQGLAEHRADDLVWG